MHARFSVKVQVSINWFLVSSEWEHRKWYRYREIDANLPCFDISLKFSCVCSGFCKNRSSVSVLISSDSLNEGKLTYWWSQSLSLMYWLWQHSIQGRIFPFGNNPFTLCSYLISSDLRNFHWRILKTYLEFFHQATSLPLILLPYQELTSLALFLIYYLAERCQCFLTTLGLL